MWTERKGLLVMLQSPQGQAPVNHELGALPLDWVEPKPLPKILLKKRATMQMCKVGWFILSKKVGWFASTFV